MRKMSLEPYSEMILDMAKQGLSSSEISARISEVSGGGRGFSARNVRRFCAENGVNLMGLPEEHLELEVAKAITEVRKLTFSSLICVCVCKEASLFHIYHNRLIE